MEQKRTRLLREVLHRMSPQPDTQRYHPEKHYMRGPGPKTLAKIGEMLRAETDGLASEAIPAHWLELIQRIKES